MNVSKVTRFLLIPSILICESARSDSLFDVASLRPSAACTASERWPDAFPKSFRSPGTAGTLQRYSEALRYQRSLQWSRKKFDTQLGSSLAHYWRARVLFDVGLLPESLEAFDLAATRAIAQGGVAAQSILPAIGACLAQVQELLPALPQALVLKHRLVQAKASIEKSPRRPETANLKSSIARYQDQKYAAALQPLGNFPRSSNLLPESLLVEAWSALQLEQYGLAVGKASSFMSTNMKRVFAPDAYWILAASYHQTCHYPEARSSVQRFLKQYSSSKNWLEGYTAATTNKPKLYPWVVQYLKSKQSGQSPVAIDKTVAPEILVADWARSHSFLERQRGINRLFKDIENLKAIRTALQQERSARFNLLKQRLTEVAALWKKVNKKLKDDDALPAEMEKQFAELRGNFQSFTYELATLPALNKLVAQGEAARPQLRDTLLTDVEADLQEIASMQLEQLNDSARNLELIQTEVFQDGARDLATGGSPAPKGAAPQKSSGSASNHYFWGSFQPDAVTEVWEDELGSLAAQVSDLCPEENES